VLSRGAVAAQHGAAVTDVRDVQVAALHHRRCGACTAAFTLRSSKEQIYDVSFTYQVWRLISTRIKQ
jgi:G:T/U-mismatch repair DNA glycosylase